MSLLSGARPYASEGIFIHRNIERINRNRCIFVLNSMKSRRQSVILEVIDREALHSQEELRRRLRQRGFDATQATISRDIADLGLVKRAGDGAYQRPGMDATSPELARTALERAASSFLRRVERVQQLIVLRTGRGQAQALAEALDR